MYIFRFVRHLSAIRILLLLLIPASSLWAQRLPSQFDLRDVNGKNYVTSVKRRQGGATWTLVEDMSSSPVWNFRSLKVSDFVSPSAQMKIRFQATDNPNDSVVEALLDDFTVERRVYEASLWADAYSASCAQGAQVTYSMDAGAANAGRMYLLLGTFSGTEPGFTLQGGQPVPINWDAFTNVVVSNLGSPLFQNFLGNLDGTGQGTALFDTLGPVDPALAGSTLSFAYILAWPPAWDFASNAVDPVFQPWAVSGRHGG